MHATSEQTALCRHRPRAIYKPQAIHKPQALLEPQALAALVGLVLVVVLVACAGPLRGRRTPVPTVADTQASERLPIDGIWQLAGDAQTLVQLERGRLYVQRSDGREQRQGQVLFAEIHQSGPTIYRCRKPVSRKASIAWEPCTLVLHEGELRERQAGSSESRFRADRLAFRPVALADEHWYDAQVGAWHILSVREAHRPDPELAVVPTQPLPELPPSPPQQEPVLPTAGRESPYGAYYALVIGTGDYLYLPSVATALDDADAVSALLQSRYGFSVRDLRNPTLDELTEAIAHYDALGENDNLLLYFAGHGFMSEELGRCYWLPADATGDDPAEGISNENLAARLRELRALRVLVVADSCFTASEARDIALEAENEDDRREIPKARARVVLTSGRLEPVQDGSGGTHSLFTGALLEALRAAGDQVDSGAVFAEIRRIVTAGASQSPEYANIRGTDHEGGDFVFVPKASLD